MCDIGKAVKHLSNGIWITDGDGHRPRNALAAHLRLDFDIGAGGAWVHANFELDRSCEVRLACTSEVAMKYVGTFNLFQEAH